ncbi:type II secretion system protein [Chloroflexota bacterium]
MRQGQKGFTLLEIILAIGIVGTVLAAALMTTTTLLLNSQQPNIQQILLQQVQNAGYWIPRDINMSSNVTLSGPNGFPFTVNIPVDQDENNNYDVEYLLSCDNLTRKQYNNLGVLASETLISSYVDMDNTTCENVTSGFYKLTIRVCLGEETVTADYEVRRRLAAEAETE